MEFVEQWELRVEMKSEEHTQTHFGRIQKMTRKKRIIFYTEHLHYTFIKFYDFAKRMREKKGELKAKRDEHQFVIFWGEYERAKQ